MNIRKFALFLFASIVGLLSLSFSAFAAVDAENSMVFPKQQVVKAAGADVLITVKLVDENGNGVMGHSVKLIPSVATSVNEYSPSGITNANGESVFMVSSKEEGVVYYSAYDATDDVILPQRAKVVYFDSAGSILGDVGNSSGPVDYLKFEDLPSKVAVGENVSFTVTAYDEIDQVVTNYGSNVRFSVTKGEDSYVNLPADYDFTPDDLGKHTFSLAMSFAQPGTYGIEVRDLNDLPIFGETEVVVASSSGASSNSGVVVSSPVAGTYSNDVQVVSGKVAPGARVKIFDNDIEIGSVIADISGNFSFTTPALTDGAHKIVVAVVNEVGTVTDKSGDILINIDVSGPSVSKVELVPSSNVAAGSVVKARLFTSDQLSKAVLDFRGNLYAMQNSGQGYYETSFAAPLETGSYDLSFIVTDVLGNEVKLDKYSKVTVGGSGAAGSSTSTGVIGNVANLNAVASDRRVTLTWDPVTAGSAPVVNYRVFFGLAPNQLSEAVDTFTNSATWYIPNLNNGVTYYFAVVAIDAAGNSSDRFSNIVSAVPSGGGQVVSTPVEVTNGTAGNDILAEMDTEVSETGPEILWLVTLALFGGVFYSQFSRKFV